jgi:hypothetical protein
MKRFQLITMIPGLVAGLGIGPLYAGDGAGYGYGFGGSYGTTDPGWYNAGSAPAPRSRVDAAGSYGFDDRWGGTRNDAAGGVYNDRRRSDPGPAAFGDLDSTGYARDYGQAYDARVPLDPESDFRTDPMHREPAPVYGQPDLQGFRLRGDSYEAAPEFPRERPRYRFRDDPRFEDKGIAGGGGDYQFRPLTSKERARRSNRQDDRAPAPDAYPYYGESPGVGDRGAAFGYQPDPPAGSFYERYFRSGP